MRRADQHISGRSTEMAGGGERIGKRGVLLRRALLAVQQHNAESGFGKRGG